MKILYFATYYVDRYVRQEVIRKALCRTDDIDVIECVYNSKSPFRHIIALWKFLRMPKKDVDVVFIGFRGHELVPFVRALTRKPLIFDAFISLYDTLCFERKKFSSRSLAGRLVFWYERWICRLVQQIVLDTDSHIQYFRQTFSLPQEKFVKVFVGADEDVFFPLVSPRVDNKAIVFYYGTALPLQGVEIILRAAKLLESNAQIRFTVVGPMRKTYASLLEQLRLTNVEFINWLNFDQLTRAISQADVCLGGHFSTVPKASRVIAGKTFQFLAMKKPVIVSSNAANRELLEDEKDCLMIEPGSPEKLAAAIKHLLSDDGLRQRISLAGYQTFCLSQRTIQKQLSAVIRSYVK